MRVSLAVFLATIPLAVPAQDLQYFPPGDILPTNVSGITARIVHFPEWTFPMKVGVATGQHAYIGTQLGRYHKLAWDNDPRLYAYPHRDNQCEPRDWTVNACPSAKGHQGNDIRANSNVDNTWEVVAVEAGTVTKVTSNTTVIVRSSGGNHSVRYLHMHPNSIAAAGIRAGVQVTRGQVLGKVSNIMNGTPNTSLHLHIDVYAGTNASGAHMQIYPSLIAAYRRAWGLDDLVESGVLKQDPSREVRGGAVRPPALTSGGTGSPTGSCRGIALAPPLATVDASTISSYWLHNCSVMGLVADNASGSRRFVYYQPKASMAALVGADPVLFVGKAQGPAYSGRAKRYSSACGAVLFDVEGPIGQFAGLSSVTLRGSYLRRDSNCQTVGSATEEMLFVHMGSSAPTPPPTPVVTLELPSDRVTLSEKTRNFLAITFYPPKVGERIIVHPYVATFPGTSVEPGLFDSADPPGLIPRMKSDEAGVGLSWVWLNKRARFVAAQTATPRNIAYSMAGVDPVTCTAEILPVSDDAKSRSSCKAVSVYLAGYIGFGSGRNFAADYFGRSVGIDEVLNFAHPEVAFNWMRTMYSHESKRVALVDADTFIRGVRYGEDWIAEYYGGETGRVRPDAWYGDPCNFGQQGCGTGSDVVQPTAPNAEAEPAETLESLAQAIRRLERRVVVLEGQ
ncbi:M23 family metallopeptidase [Paracoccus actinidiae]|uniref:M23 family metallopeptidase n=1 Tax=Paracoccus actinidiae TaxID=3064531 RepID=UPI0027D2B3CF|nr:M23 family metallopeptidase [Paracoccus sp. M09]